jgi:hypothetical protein
MSWILLLVLGGAGVAWLGSISLQSLRQAQRLRSLTRFIARGAPGEGVAVHGTVKILQPLDVRGIGPCLWYRLHEEELESPAWRLVSRRRYWHTTQDSSRIATFTVTVGGEEVEVADPPTEVKGPRRATDYESAGCLGPFFSETDYRMTQHWLPFSAEVTVVGRLGDRRVLVRDPAPGLLLSPDPADVAANAEAMKGWAGMAGVVAGACALPWLLLRKGRW